MNRQPIPDAGAKLSQYQRRLSRRNNETIPQFLVREDSAYDSMWKALQRLLRQKALDFSKYEVTEAELKTFCGVGPMGPDVITMFQETLTVMIILIQNLGPSVVIPR